MHCRDKEDSDRASDTGDNDGVCALMRSNGGERCVSSFSFSVTHTGRETDGHTHTHTHTHTHMYIHSFILRLALFFSFVLPAPQGRPPIQLTDAEMDAFDILTAGHAANQSSGMHVVCYPRVGERGCVCVCV